MFGLTFDWTDTHFHAHAVRSKKLKKLFNVRKSLNRKLIKHVCTLSYISSAIEIIIKPGNCMVNLDHSS